MKCMTCGAPISPAFKAAILANKCPGCGGDMMNEATQELLEELKKALEEMPSDAEGIAGWLLSHYELRKIGTGEPVQQFYGGPTAAQLQKIQQMQNVGTQLTPLQIQQMQLQQMNGGGSKEDQLRNNPVIAENKLQQFYRDAGIKRDKTPSDYAAIAAQIQAGGSDYGDFEEGQGQPSIQQLQQLQQMQQLQQLQQLQQMQQMQNMGGPIEGQPLPISPQMQKQLQQIQMMKQRNQQQMMQMNVSPEPYVEEALDPQFTQQALSAMQGGGVSTGGSLSPNDLAELQSMVSGSISDNYDDNLPPGLQIGRMDRLEKQQSLQNMGSVGKIKRSS